MPASPVNGRADASCGALTRTQAMPASRHALHKHDRSRPARWLKKRGTVWQRWQTLLPAPIRGLLLYSRLSEAPAAAASSRRRAHLTIEKNCRKNFLQEGVQATGMG